MSRLSGWGLAALVLVLSAVYFWVYHASMLAGPLRFNDDVVQHYLWLYDTDWADDFYARTSGVIQPWGFYGLLWTLGHFADPLPISRYGPLLITFLTAWFTLGVLRRYLPLVLSLAGTYLVLQYTIDTGLGFLARSFSTPLLIGFAYFLVRRWAWGVAAMLVLSALFYPPVLLINGVILLGWEVGQWLRKRRAFDWRAALPAYSVLVVGGLLALAIAAAQSYAIRQHPALGEFFSQAELRSMPEFGASGRVPFTNITNTPTWWIARYFLRLYFGTSPAIDFGLFVLGVSFVLGLVTRRRLGGLATYLLLFFGATLGLYHLARLTTPLLFLADRYVAYPWRLGVGLVIVFLGGALWSLFPRQWSAYLAAAGLLCIGFFIHRPSELSVLKMSPYAQLYDYLAQLPEDAMIVAPPVVASYIPLVSRRSVLLSNESAHALYFRHYYDYITPRYTDYMRAIVAPSDSLGRVIELLDKYGGDYLIVDRKMLSSPLNESFAPYDKQYAAGTRVQSDSAYAVLQIPDALGVRIKEFLIVERERLRAYNDTR